MRCGLLGRKLGHSYSPQIHAHLGDYPYTLFEKEPDQIADFLRNGEFDGLNVTIPYKKDVIPYCAELSPPPNGWEQSIPSSADPTEVSSATTPISSASVPCSAVLA